MLPSLQSGDVVRLAPFDGRLCAGDLVVYPGRRSRSPVLHRVVKADGGNVCLVGDNATVFTDIQRADIVGMARSVFLDGEWHSVSVAVEQGLLIAELSDSIREASLGKRIGEVERLQRKRRAECQKWRENLMGRVVYTSPLGRRALVWDSGSAHPSHQPKQNVSFRENNRKHSTGTLSFIKLTNATRGQDDMVCE